MERWNRNLRGENLRNSARNQTENGVFWNTSGTDIGLYNWFDFSHL
jgi:hypothetical protein